ncbi:MAG: M1 family metallopeptidase, partial [Saprospiraceae bacterium]|nr:M1 family metallopeptidase [Saprospiraceae bacterium]
MKKLLLFVFILGSITGYSQENTNQNKFRQLGQDLPTPNNYRNAAGAPGSDYWQQKVDYKMDIEIDDDNQKLIGSSAIKYHNNSPDELTYLWLQLDQNVRSPESDSPKLRGSNISNSNRVSLRGLKRMQNEFEGGFKIESVTNKEGQALSYTINKTMMRVDLPQPLKPGQSTDFNVKWWYNINNTRVNGGRSGYEPFAEDGNNVYVIAQFFPRMCKYYDVYGWQNKQFLGRGEFTLEFGDYDVNITVPADHLVSSTGVLTNEGSVLTSEQKSRMAKARKTFDQPVTIATREEADERIKSKAKKKKTWKYSAQNVRDFAFATSRRFIWDALNVKLPNGKDVMAMSMWVKEGDCLWKKYSTKAIAQTLRTYSKYTIDYPYPVAWSIDGSMGMEYPMICFNYGRCQDDDTYSKRTKYGHIGVIIHEVGHNWFPMIINSDERQWTWMDEGLNTFVQYLTEQEFERNYPSRRGPAANIVNYMKGDKDKISPIMTNSESIFQFGNNAYGKPATALNILRETIMGRELFDYAFKEYARRWAFKTPTPADFFRTMEDASGVDLDWFWRGWFYTNDHVDLAMNSVKHFKLDPEDPTQRMEIVKAEKKEEYPDISTVRNATSIKETYNEKDPTLNDFYTTYDADVPNALDIQEYEEYIAGLSEDEKALLNSGMNYYEIEFENVGGLPMPVILEFEYKDGTKSIERIPAELWKLDAKTITKVFPTEKEVSRITLDPYKETADVDTSNNNYPPKAKVDRFDMFKKSKRRTRDNPMQRDAKAK